MNTINENNRNQFYYTYGLSAAIFVASLLLSNPAAIVASAAILLLAVLFLNSGHIINGMLIKRSKVIEVSGNYRLSSNLNSISRSGPSGFKSISMALLTPRTGSQIKNDSLKDLLDSISEQFEFSIELVEVNKAKIVENLRTKLRLKEISLSRMDGRSYDKVNGLKRQIDMINGEIASLLSGGKSFQFAIKIRSICMSDNQNEAEFYSAKNIEILANKFSAALGLDYELVHGEKLLEYCGV